MPDVQIESERVEVTSQSESTVEGGTEESKSGLKTYELIPGRVMLTTRHTPPTEEVDRRNWVEERYGLRLVPIEEVIRNRTNTQGQ